MPWCPKCKSEYEDSVSQCAECHVDLVEDIQKVTQYRSLIIANTESVQSILDYLEFSKINDYRLHEVKQGTEILVRRDQYDDALKYIKGYIREKQQEVQEEDLGLCINEYETSVADESKIKESQSSFFAFFVIGIGLITFCLLDLFNIISVVRSDVILYVFLLVGIVFLVISYSTRKKIHQYKDLYSDKENKQNEMIQWYEQTFSRSADEFFQQHNISKDQYDEGALYFACIDAIKLDLKKQYPEHSEQLLNDVAETIYNKI